MKRLSFVFLLVIGIALLSFSTNAASALVIIPKDDGSKKIPLSSWTKEAKAPLPDAVVDVYNSTCPEAPSSLGCTTKDTTRHYSIWIAPVYTQASDERFKRIFYHELSHVFDGRYLTSYDRRLATSYLGYPSSVQWDGTDDTSGLFFASPQEWFAEAGSFCYAGSAAKWPAYKYPYGYGQETLNVCQLMNIAATRTPPPSRQNYQKTIGANKRFTSAETFETSSIKIKLKINGRVFNWGNNCQNSTRYRGLNVILNGCGKKLVGRTIGTGKVVIQYSGIPYSIYSE